MAAMAVVGMMALLWQHSIHHQCIGNTMQVYASESCFGVRQVADKGRHCTLAWHCSAGQKVPHLAAACSAPGCCVGGKEVYRLQT